MIKPAIVAVGYNRPDCMKRLLTSIVNAVYEYEDITLIISIDECDKSDAVQAVADEIVWTHGEKIIRRFPERQGLVKHIIQCGDLSEKYGTVIILEDDLFVAPGFYNYICHADKFYGDDDNICGYALYSEQYSPYIGYGYSPEKNKYDNYFAQFVITWGQCWRYNKWTKFKNWIINHKYILPSADDRMPTEILSWKNAWSKFFISFMLDEKLFYVVPYISLSTNFSEKGEHKDYGGYETTYQVPLLSGIKEYNFAPFEEGVKYDSFFERIFDEKEIAPGIKGSDVCVDLYGTRASALGKKYLLTCKKYSLPLIRTYALRMRPVEANVIYNVEGHGINLYELDRDIELIPRKKKSNYMYKYNTERIRYEVYGMGYRKLIPYVVCLIKEAFARKLGKIFKRRK